MPPASSRTPSLIASHPQDAIMSEIELGNGLPEIRSTEQVWHCPCYSLL